MKRAANHRVARGSLANVSRLWWRAVPARSLARVLWIMATLYAAARIAAQKVHPRFAPMDAETIEQLIDCAFWASLILWISAYTTSPNWQFFHS